METMTNDRFDSDKPNGNRNFFMIVLCCCAVIAAIVVAYYLGKNYPAAERENLTALTDSVKDAVKTDTPRVGDKAQKASAMKQPYDKIGKCTESDRHTICDEYERLLNENSRQASDCSYFLYDIDRDNIPELWIKTGNCEADYRLLVYTYHDGIKQLYDDGAGHSCLYKGKGYILQVYAHMGVAFWNKLTYKNGRISARIIYEENILDTDRDYTEPKEKEIMMYPSEDKQHIYDI
ncbi:MAG: hypothetical protein ACI4V5_02670 [Prevotella sp.]